MKIVPIAPCHLSAASALACAAYRAQRAVLPALPVVDEGVFGERMSKAVRAGNGFVCLREGSVAGYMVYDEKSETETDVRCRIPLWGVGALEPDRGQIVSRLFQAVAASLCSKKCVSFAARLYAHDTEIQRLFSFTQFAVQSEYCIRDTAEEIFPTGKAAIRVLDKAEIAGRWMEIWPLFQKLIDHLKESPVFYPGTEFTQSVYRAYLLDDDTRLYVAEENGAIVSVIDANREGCDFVTSRADTWNVGDAYVPPEKRGTRLAQTLLQYANDDLRAAGIRRAWVEHGTANPNARGFWNKYFKTYAYLFIRTIPPITRS